jgi:hypothetical protein
MFSAGPVCSCAFLCRFAHETAGAARIRLSLHPLVFRRVEIHAKLGRIAPRECGRTPSRCLTIESVCPRPLLGRSFFVAPRECEGPLTFQRVVPANAGTHHPWPKKRKKGLCFCRRRGSSPYGSLRSQGRPRQVPMPTPRAVQLPRRLRQRGENPRPRTNTLVETLEVVFFVRRMDVVVVEPKTDQHGIEAERALEIGNDRDRCA